MGKVKEHWSEHFCRNLILQNRAKSAKCLPFECFFHKVCHTVLYMEDFSGSEDVGFITLNPKERLLKKCTRMPLKQKRFWVEAGHGLEGGKCHNMGV